MLLVACTKRSVTLNKYHLWLHCLQFSYWVAKSNLQKRTPDYKRCDWRFRSDKKVLWLCTSVTFLHHTQPVSFLTTACLLASALVVSRVTLHWTVSLLCDAPVANARRPRNLQHRGNIWQWNKISLDRNMGVMCQSSLFSIAIFASKRQFFILIFIKNIPPACTERRPDTELPSLCESLALLVNWAPEIKC